VVLVLEQMGAGGAEVNICKDTFSTIMLTLGNTISYTADRWICSLLISSSLSSFSARFAALSFFSKQSWSTMKMFSFAN
jgi:hypothetical protein